MKTPKQHLINIITAKSRGLMLLLIGLAFSLTAFGQEKVTYNINLTAGSLTFKSNKDVYQGNTKIATHANSNVYIITTNNVATTNTITIETVNLVPSGASNQGMTYKITLKNVKIDRSGLENPLGSLSNLYDGHWCGTHYAGWSISNTPGNTNNVVSKYNAGVRLPFNAGDDTVQVDITIEGTNVIKGEPGANAALQYVSVDCTGGITGNKSLTIQESGTASLTISKDGSMNSGAAFGAPMCGAGNSVNVKNGSIVINSGTITASTGGPVADPPTQTTVSGVGTGYHNNAWLGNFAAAIGGGACNRGGDVTINGGTVTATSYATAAAIGGGGGHVAIGAALDGTITITGGTVKTYSYGDQLVHETGVGIGGGSANQNSGASANQIIISGGTVEVWKWQWTTNFNSGTLVKGNIGGGNSDLQKITDVGTGGDVTNIQITDGTVYAGNIGGGSDAMNGNGGTASVTMTGGTVNLTGKIGGGSSAGTGRGGDANVTISGGRLYCSSIGGGDTGTGTPGSVSHPDDPVTGDSIAGVRISGADTEVYTGFIGGGTNAAGNAFGKATASITGGKKIQGQFILVNSSSSPENYSYFVMTDGTIDNSGLTGSTYVRKRDSGGAVYMEDNNGRVIIKGGTIKNAHAINSGHGGAIYMTNGTFTMEGDAEILDCTAAGNGGAVYLGNGTVKIKANTSGLVPSMDGNSAVNGGALFMNAGSCNITACNIGTTKSNTASGSGGGIYTNGSITFSNGNICNNKANSNTVGQGGGGIYISSTGSLTLSGTAVITGNKAPTTNGQGGGVYLGGTMTADGTSLNVSGNTKGASKAETANNVYLPDSKTIAVGSGISANVTLGITTQHTYDDLGTHIAVLTGNKDKLRTIYQAMTNGTSNIHDDRGLHRAEYTYPETTLFFTKVLFDYGPYSTAFSGDIDSKEKLYQFMCWVNGLNGYGDTHPGATGNVTADINMYGISHWFPIGEPNVVSSTTPYTGTFNGNGHTISNLTFNDDLVQNWGLFGTIDGAASISDVFVKGFNMTAKPNQGGLGTLVGKMLGGTVQRCGGTGTLSTTEADCLMGGLVGTQQGGTIHSSFATTTMTGYQMGGLVGETASGSNLKNSFANASFALQSGSTKYLGGLVGVNKGTVENCYARIQTSANPSSTCFGWIAGQNDGGTITYCYHPTTAYGASYVKSGSVANTCTTFGATATPYGYMHDDNQMTDNDDNDHIVNGNLDRFGLKGLLATLNDWVESSSTYSKWMRTCASPINGDYPVFAYTGYDCVASRNNIDLEYASVFNSKFSEYVTANTGTIYLYKTPAALTPSGTDPEANVNVSNYGKATKLYIHEDVALKPASVSGSKATGDIEAYVGITLDNSAGTNGATPSFGGEDAIDWHFFSSVLKDAKLGLVYSPTTSVAYGTAPSQTTFDGTNNQYFPTNLNSYYNDWDLYAYYEPDYHWINLKRNSLSHWHEDANHLGEHAWINYPNETRFEPGHGYMVALKEEGYLQAYGTLNTHEDAAGKRLAVPVSYTSGIGWTGREGHNLLGNPYQSYLDFKEFVSGNSALWDDPSKAFYIVMDEDKKDYVLYTYGQSANESQASRYIHPHQGFMIVSDKAGTAYFHDGMRTVTMETGWTSSFRGEAQPNYPLVNLFATDDNGNRDIVTVELGRPDKGGAIKSHSLRTGKGSLYCNYEDEDYALVFTRPGLDAANIRFATDEDCAYTMTWNTQNGEFGYLHLIDNMTGADIDCLTDEEYRFTSKTTDYKSRFRLLFDYTGIDDHEVPEPVEGPATFAYYANGEIHLTDADGDASLQIIDMTGRVIVSRDGVHTVSTTGMAAGVYVLRLTTANGTRTQKIILN